MTRAVCLTTVGDPYKVGVWVECYKRFIQKDVDKLYVCINSDAEQPILDYCATKFEEVGAELVLAPSGSAKKFLPFGAGPRVAMKYLFEAVKEDVIYSSEDDFFMLQPGHVDQWFKEVESSQFDAAASFRCCATTAFKNKVVEKFNLKNEAAHQPFLCHVPLVIKRDDLLKVDDREYGSIGVPVGTFIPELNWVATEWSGGDVMSWATMKLYAAGLKNFHRIYQWNWIDCVYYNNSTPPWIHTTGGCAMYVGGPYLVKPDGSILGCSKNLGSDLPPHPHTQCNVAGGAAQCVRESMQAFWRVAYKYFPIPTDSLAAYFNDEFLATLDWVELTLKTTNGAVGIRPDKLKEQMDFYESVLCPVTH